MLASVIGTCYLAALAMMDALRREVAVWILWVGSAAALISATILLAGGKASWPELIFGAVPGLLMLAVAGFTKEAGPGDGIVLNGGIFCRTIVAAKGKKGYQASLSPVFMVGKSWGHLFMRLKGREK